jgi:DNA-binding CsgD family transcriptional regulator
MVDTMTPRGQFILRLLTRREREILPLVCAGFSNRKIGERILIGDQVVKNYLRGLFKKVGVESRHELVVFAWKHGIVACPCQARSQFRSQRQKMKESGTDGVTTVPSVRGYSVCPAFPRFSVPSANRIAHKRDPLPMS